MPTYRNDTPIEELNLSVRAHNVLERNGLKTVGAVMSKTDEELLGLRNLGRQAFNEIKEKLSRHST